MPRTEFLQIRLTPADRQRLEALAAAEHLDTSTWARRELLKVADRFAPGERQEHAEDTNAIP